MIKKVLVSILALSLAVGAFGQSLEENLGTMLSDNAEMYLQPLGDAFGSGMNSAWYHRSKVHKMLGFDISVKAMIAAVPEESEFFNFALSQTDMEFDLDAIIGADVNPLSLSFDDIYYETDTRTPTFFGPADSAGLLVTNQTHLAGLFEDHLRTEMTALLTSQGVNAALIPGLVDQAIADADLANEVGLMDLDLPLPPGIGLPALPLVMPQLSLGLPMGIELTVRGMPDIEDEDIGTISMYGGGLRLNIDQFIPIPLFPVDITAGAFYSQMAIGDIIESSNMSLGLQVGKSMNLLIFGVGVYVDAAYETSSLSIGYDVDPEFGIENDRMQFDMETDPGMRLGAGLHLKLIPLTYFNVHVSQTPTNSVVTAGFGISLR
ncbi:MAG: hypothetical protein HN995_05545 [Candidatus Marinimicrobia bacterium]|jgi:hypothetical protein|nr:hypothetical protein [Candidatus Neomarinimicrobiota bacterium]MBT3575641.1 hypothetical protein [Candidatus Neomarinimicrobiota bacterium]MBT3679876.1 hypothetical protein [Candidatus Neomarinimicrobiota bacterium]MBT3952038.1 hypothetical protein [Candidatus Neomarinimicrobiota bacterium]MBT4251929.1 hypothetical protein [Candidatus Neomarinimicrobiota bacterium]